MAGYISSDLTYKVFKKWGLKNWISISTCPSFHNVWQCWTYNLNSRLIPECMQFPPYHWSLNGDGNNWTTPSTKDCLSLEIN